MFPHVLYRTVDWARFVAVQKERLLVNVDVKEIRVVTTEWTGMCLSSSREFSALSLIIRFVDVEIQVPHT